MRRRLLLYICIVFLAVFTVGCSNVELPDRFTTYIVSVGDSTYEVIFDQKSRNEVSGVAYKNEGTAFPEYHSMKVRARRAGGSILLIDGSPYDDFELKEYSLEAFKVYGETPSYEQKRYSVVGPTTVTYATVPGYWSSDPERGDSYATILVSHILDLLDTSNLDLDMDIYEPEGDGNSRRPLIVFFHGGAFFNGDKADPVFQRWCRDFASRGYIAVSVNYRLGFPVIQSEGSEYAAYRALQDANAAIRYLIEYKDRYRIDEDRIFVTGCSAGAIIALNLAYVDENSYYADHFAMTEGAIDSINPEMNHEFKVKAIGNMWGALVNLEFLSNSNTPIVSYQGKDDPVMPYAVGYPFEESFGVLSGIVFPRMYGASLIDRQAREMGRESVLHAFDVAKHNLYEADDPTSLDIEMTEYLSDNLAEFFDDHMTPHSVKITQYNGTNQFYIDTDDLENYCWRMTDGVIIEKRYGNVVVIPHMVGNPKLEVSGRFSNGMTFHDVLSWDDL